MSLAEKTFITANHVQLNKLINALNVTQMLLKWMKMENVLCVETKKDGKSVYYKMDPSNVSVNPINL